MKIKTKTISERLGSDFVEKYIEKYKDIDFEIEKHGTDIVYISSEDRGIEYLVDDDYELISIFFMNEEVNDYKKFMDQLPFSLKFGMGRVEVNELLGTPLKINEKGLPALDIYPYETFKKNDCQISVTYEYSFEIIRSVQVSTEVFES